MKERKDLEKVNAIVSKIIPSAYTALCSVPCINLEAGVAEGVRKCQ